MHTCFCAAVSCPVPDSPEHGRVVFNSVSFNSLVSYECNYGYRLEGEGVRSVVSYPDTLYYINVMLQAV